jgi:hypothetical protein
MLFKDTDGTCHTYEELIALVGETQKDKNGKVIYPTPPMRRHNTVSFLPQRNVDTKCS